MMYMVTRSTTINKLIAPAQLVDWLARLPSANIGTLYATIKWPFLPVYTGHKVKVWGQICDGKDHRDVVHLMLYNDWPIHGKGFTYVSWRAVPDHPEDNKHPRTGKVKTPRPYSGIAYE